MHCATITLLLATCLVVSARPSLSPRAAGKTYPTPPLPSKQMYHDASSYTLSKEFRITDVPHTREYFWNIEAVTGAPDGYPRRMYTINGQFPGPLIEANTGDEIVVHVNNYLDIPQTIHWHGLHQNGTNNMDGVTGFSQCPIPSGGNFTYRFNISEQYGTYWYHSHYSNTLGDGIHGAFIVHNPEDPLKRGVDFDEEMAVLVGDWYDVVSEVIVQAIRTDEGFNGYNGGGPFGYADSNLINGVGQTNCTNQDIADPSLCDRNVRPFEFKVPTNSSLRMRLINPSTQSSILVSLDHHSFEVVEVDGTPVWGPKDLHEFQIAPGERTSIVVNATQGSTGDVFWFRANAVSSTVGTGSNTGLAAFRYVKANGKATTDQLPDTKPWDDLSGDSARDIAVDQIYNLVPRIPLDAPTDIATVNILNSKGGRFVDVYGHSFNGFGFNNVSFQAQAGYPLLQQVMDGNDINQGLVHTITFPYQAGGDIVVNNLDFFGPNAGIAHPMHVHGKSFFLVGRGPGQIASMDDLAKVQLNTENPLRRDTIALPYNTWAVLRMVTDVPGVWPIHCHIGLHLSEGKMAAMVIQPNVVQGFDAPSDWQNLCASFDKHEIDPTLGR